MRSTLAHRGRQFKLAPDGRTITGEILKQIIPKDLIHEAILNPLHSWYGSTLSREPVEDQFVKHTYPAEGCFETAR